MAIKKSDKIQFACVSCGSVSPKWLGKCPDCGSWNSFVEVSETSARKKNAPTGQLLSDVKDSGVSRIKTGINEFDLVCGGGVVKGAVILIGGEPGIGKSTLSMQIAGTMKTLYISGEESATQIRDRAKRLGVDLTKVIISTDTSAEDIAALVEKFSPEAVFVDSIQTISSDDIPAPAGSLSQIKTSAAKLTTIAKQKDIPLFLIGHITKEGGIAGPKVLEHIVDTVLYFEGDWAREYRVLRSFKNRYGSVNEIGLFIMGEKGLVEVTDKNALFLNPYSTDAPGGAVSAAIEGSRTILFEVQSLVTGSSFSNPRRMADGFDFNRLVIIAAVLEKHASLALSANDLFVNVAGGFSISETSADMAVAASIISSFTGLSVSRDSGFLGEISLSGDIRPVTRLMKRITEFERSGFKKLYISPHDAAEIKKNDFKGELIIIRNVRELAEMLRKKAC